MMDNDDYPPFMRNTMRDSVLRAAPVRGCLTSCSQRGATPLMWKQWQTTDAEELRRGAETGRPRVKFVDTAEMLATAR
jgi:ferredoxin/flavodoxin---NADP+ reductase